LIFVEERRGEARRAGRNHVVEVMGGGRRNGEGFSDSVRSCAEI
jgi:hypothetical protein